MISAFFKEADLSFLDDDFEQERTSGAENVVRHIITKCTDELDERADWASQAVRCMPDFLIRALADSRRFITAEGRRWPDCYTFSSTTTSMSSLYSVVVIARLDTPDPNPS